MNLLLVRTSALGDVVHTLPVLRALRRRFPEARIAWVVEEVFAPLLEGHPDLDAVVRVRLRAWRKALWSRGVRAEIAAARRAIRDFAPDVALDLMGNHKSAAVVGLSGARRRLGARRADRREPSSALWINEPVAVRGEHAVDRLLSLLAPLGVDAGDEAGAADFAGDALLRPAPAATEALLAAEPRSLVLLQAGAGWGNKTYPAAWWGEVARRLAEDPDVAVWVPTAPGEEPLAEAVAAASGGAARTVDARSFHALAALLRGAALLVGGDTGPLHLADALGTAVLAVMGPTDPRRHGPYRAPANVVFRRLPCSFCHRRFAEPKACLLAIPPREVADRARRLLCQNGRP